MTEPTNRIALQRERDRAIALLSQRFAEDLIDEDELDTRLEQAQQAETLEQLRVLTVDLVDPDAPADPGRALVPQSAAVPAVGSPSVALARPDDVREHDRAVALFGEVKHTGKWTPPRILTSFTAFGETQLDLREAILAPGVTEIEVQAILGDVQIIVPPGLPVEIGCSAILASLSADDEVSPTVTDPAAPSVRVTGFAVLAEVSVTRRLPGESKRDAKKRKKAERKALKKARKQQALE